MDFWHLLHHTCSAWCKFVILNLSRFRQRQTSICFAQIILHLLFSRNSGYLNDFECCYRMNEKWNVKVALSKFVFESFPIFSLHSTTRVHNLWVEKWGFRVVRNDAWNYSLWVSAFTPYFYKSEAWFILNLVRPRSRT